MSDKRTQVRRRRFLRLGAGASALCLAAAVQAQDKPIMLDEMVVVGSRGPAKISNLASTVWVISGEQIQSQVRAGASLQEALAMFIPSLDVATQSRTNFGQNMRGRPVLVMINGVSLNSARGISRQFDSIDPFNIARIEVLSGATAVYGGGATGGIINIITKRGQRETQFTTQVGATSGFNDSEDYQVRVAQAVSGGNDFVQARLGIAYQQNGAFYDADGEPILPDITQTDLQYNRSIGVLGTLDFNLPADQSLSVTAHFYDSRFNGDRGLYLGRHLRGLRDPRFGGNPDLLDVREGFESDRVPATRRYMATATYHNPDLLGQEFYLQGFYRSEEVSFYPFPHFADFNGDGQPDYYYSTSKQNTVLYGLKAVFVTDLKSVRLRWGLDARREEFDANQMLFNVPLAFRSGGLKLEKTTIVGRYPTYQVTTYSPFLQAEWQVTERLQFSAGVRYEHSRVEVEDFVDVDQQVAIAKGFANSADAVPGGSNDYDLALFNVGAVFNLSFSDQLWVSFSQGFDIPNPAKYYGQGKYKLVDGHYELLDSINVEEEPLKGIKTSQVELGWRHFGNHITAQVAAYYAWSDKALSYDEQNLAVKVLEDKIRTYGIAGKLIYWFNDHWRIGGTAHLVRSEHKINGEWRKREVEFASPSKATAFVGWQAGGTELRLQIVRSFDVEDYRGHEINGFHTVDLIGSQKLPVGKLAFGISNLLGAEYTTTWGQRAKLFYAKGTPISEKLFDYNGRGRTYSLTYTIKW